MFQVGDKVRVLDDGGISYLKVGDIVTVERVNSWGNITKIEGVDEGFGYLNEWFELVERNTFKVGNKVKRIRTHDPKMFELVESETIVGDAGVDTSGFQQISYQYPFKGFGVGGLVNTLQYEIVNKVNSNNKKPMSLLNTLRKITMTEPNRSNMKAGIIDEDKNLTAEGRDVVMHILYEDYAERIKKEVSDKILKEQEKK